MNINREDLDRMWTAWRLEHVITEEAQIQFDALLAAERIIVDREAQARAIRWVATLSPIDRRISCAWIDDLADRVERGDREVPR